MSVTHFMQQSPGARRRNQDGRPPLRTGGVKGYRERRSGTAYKRTPTKTLIRETGLFLKMLLKEKIGLTKLIFKLLTDRNSLKPL